jgi:hypothetical protein
MKFRKKPVVIEAMRLVAGDADYDEALLHFLEGCPFEIVAEYELVIHTLEGDMTARPGDWIIHGVQGEFYPCKPDIFDATYEAVDE